MDHRNRLHTTPPDRSTGRATDRVARAGRARVVASLVAAVMVVGLVLLAVPTARRSALRLVGHDTAGQVSGGAALVGDHPSGPLGVVGLGDSVEQGYHCTGCTNFLQLTANRLAALQHRTASVTNVSGDGYTTSDILARLGDAAIRRTIAASDLVVIEIGANDLDASLATADTCVSDPVGQCWGDDLRSVRSHLTTIVQRVHALQTRPSARIVVMGYWNVFTDGRVATALGSNYVQSSTLLTKAFNQDVHEVAAAAGVRWADAWTPFRGTSGTADDTQYLASDGDHPNQAGHQLLANAVVSALGADAATL